MQMQFKKIDSFLKSLLGIKVKQTFHPAFLILMNKTFLLSFVFFYEKRRKKG